MTANVALRITGLSKHFGGVQALSDVSMEIYGGEVHGLLGQNGSGKSTVVKILTGVYRPDEGTISVWGDDLSLPVANATAIGLAVIHQDLGLSEFMSVLENVESAVNYGTGILGRIRRADSRRELQGILGELDLDLDPDTRIAELTPAERAYVAVARALRVLHAHDGKRILILDEPTTALSGADAERIMSLMRRIADAGNAVVFISHRVREVMAACDRITVLRDGKTVLQGSEIDHLDAFEITSAILGRRIEQFYPEKTHETTANPHLIVENLRFRKIQDVSFKLYHGEVLGISGLAGMGQEDLPAVLSGNGIPDGGRIVLNGKGLASRSDQSIQQGVALVPGNRLRDGAWVDASASENLVLPILGSLTKRGWLRTRWEKKVAADLMERAKVVPNDPTKRFGDFSGGNQQKIVMAKWLNTEPQLLVCDEPTQGVDVGAKREIVDSIYDVVKRGGSVVVVSGDYEQLAEICNRVLVMHDGSIVDELYGSDLTTDAVALSVLNSAPPTAGIG